MHFMIKQLSIFLVLATLLFTVGCSKAYDDADVWNSIPLYDTLSILFDEADLVVMSPNSTRNIGYTVTSGTDSVVVEVTTSSDIKAKIVADDKNGKSGKIQITTATTIDEHSKVIVFVSNGNKVIMRSITFEEAGMVVEDNTTKIATADGGEVELEFLSNVEYEVAIPGSAKEWISVVPVTRALTKQTITLKVEPNKGFYRSATVTIQSYDGNLKLEYRVEQEGNSTTRTARTVLVYIMAENSLTGAFASDLSEIKRGVSSIPDDCYLLVFVDAIGSKPYICRFYENEVGVAVCDTVYEFQRDFYSTDSAKFHDVVSWVLDYFPSENFGLVMWSYGTGWLYDSKSSRSIGEDNGKDLNDVVGSSRWMEVEELAAALKDLPVKTDFVFFDACFMQCIEVAYAMRESADWLVGSPAEIPAEGAPYDKIMPSLFSIPFDANALIESYKGGYSDNKGVVLSAVKCSAVESLAEVSAAFIPAYFSHSFQIDDSGVFSYLRGGRFTYQSALPNYFDMNGQMKLRFPEDAYLLWKEAFDAAVPYRIATNRWYSVYKGYQYVDFSQFGGLSMYVPRNNTNYSTLNENFKRTEWYQATGWESAGW